MWLRWITLYSAQSILLFMSTYSLFLIIRYSIVSRLRLLYLTLSTYSNLMYLVFLAYSSIKIFCISIPSSLIAVFFASFCYFVWSMYWDHDYGPPSKICYIKKTPRILLLTYTFPTEINVIAARTKIGKMLCVLKRCLRTYRFLTNSNQPLIMHSHNQWKSALILLYLN